MLLINFKFLTVNSLGIDLYIMLLLLYFCRPLEGLANYAKYNAAWRIKIGLGSTSRELNFKQKRQKASKFTWFDAGTPLKSCAFHFKLKCQKNVKNVKKTSKRQNLRHLTSALPLKTRTFHFIKNVKNVKKRQNVKIDVSAPLKTRVFHISAKTSKKRQKRQNVKIYVIWRRHTTEDQCFYFSAKTSKNVKT